MAITINGTTGITSAGGYTGDGVVLADNTPANTLVTTTGGNVGIGTDAPAARLESLVSGTGVYFSGGDSSGGRRLQISATTTANTGDTQNFNALGVSGVLAFRTNSTERARIDSSGNLMVATTSTSTNSSGFRFLPAGSAGGSLLSVTNLSGGTPLILDTNANTSIQVFRRSGTNVGSINVTTTATSYATSSDYRLKENVAPMVGALEKVAALKPVTYTWKADGSQGQGFIAHELQAVVPDCVTGEKDAVDAEGNPQYQGVDTSFLVATLVAAIQELKAEVDALKGATP